ncbi:hypothetical protein PVAP13_2KG239058 [Panicum virgatum]|uniref:Uncharacterized protein n=1 Tax=Panicum virgatum TaxID=38727 RepID=A0A8T0VZY5_PANVG|nr:hypothetical protein PVAP13_2KG239058 [Panicum virgatum]
MGRDPLSLGVEEARQAVHATLRRRSATAISPLGLCPCSLSPPDLRPKPRPRHETRLRLAVAGTIHPQPGLVTTPSRRRERLRTQTPGAPGSATYPTPPACHGHPRCVGTPVTPGHAHSRALVVDLPPLRITLAPLLLPPSRKPRPAAANLEIQAPRAHGHALGMLRLFLALPSRLCSCLTPPADLPRRSASPPLCQEPRKGAEGMGRSKG